MIESSGFPKGLRGAIEVFRSDNMGVDYGERTGDKSPPEFGVGDANAIVPSDSNHIGTKRSVLWPSK